MWNSKVRLVVILTTLILFGFISTSLISYFVAHDSISEQMAETTLPLTSDNIYSEIQQDLLRPIFISSLMAQDTFVRDWTIDGEADPKAIVRYLNEIKKRYDTITTFFVSEKTRRYYHPTGVIKQIKESDANDAWYFRVKELRSDYEINVDKDTADKNSLTIFINYRVYDYAGNYIGVTGVGLAVDAVTDLIKTYQNRYGRRVFFTDREGAIMLHGARLTEHKNIRQIPGLTKLATQILTSPSFASTYEYSNQTIYLNSRLVPEFDWYLLVEQVEDPAEERLLNTLWGNLAASITITVVVLFLVNLTIGGYQRKLEEMATTDKLTGVINRQLFDALYDQASRLSKRRAGELSMIMLDIDFFKKVNDTYGHPTGDTVLKDLARHIKGEIRVSDTICRWGGEEFLLLLPECSLEQSSQLAEKIRHSVSEKIILTGCHSISITVSIGVVQQQNGESLSSIVQRADQALYRAKASGRNRIEIDA